MNLKNNLTPLFIMQTCKGREHYAKTAKGTIPFLHLNYDDFENESDVITSAWKNYIRGWRIAGEYPTVQMDDDIIFCNNFYERILTEIHKRPDDVIQFFSMRKADLSIGSRYENGSNFMMQQCYYLPAGLANELYNYAIEYEKTMTEKGCPTDILMQKYFKSNKIKYWVVVPNLVNHIDGVSVIDKRRSSKRQSLTFRKD